MSETKHFLKNWGMISVTAFVLNFALWYFTTDDETLLQYPYSCADFVFDTVYCDPS